jgi:energy-coupling factor transporter ATP-binding protein EcfA2
MNAITVEHLSKKVPDAGGWLTILDDVGFTVAAGETVAIVGASGSGKSTLLGLLAGLDLPTEGRIIASGQDLFAMDEDQREAERAPGHPGLRDGGDVHFAAEMECAQKTGCTVSGTCSKRSRGGTWSSTRRTV